MTYLDLQHVVGVVVEVQARGLEGARVSGVAGAAVVHAHAVLVLGAVHEVVRVVLLRVEAVRGPGRSSPLPTATWTLHSTTQLRRTYFIRHVMHLNKFADFLMVKEKNIKNKVLRIFLIVVKQQLKNANLREMVIADKKRKPLS